MENNRGWVVGYWYSTSIHSKDAYKMLEINGTSIKYIWLCNGVPIAKTLDGFVSNAKSFVIRWDLIDKEEVETQVKEAFNG